MSIGRAAITKVGGKSVGPIGYGLMGKFSSRPGTMGSPG